VLGTTYRGCDLLGELAENMSRLSIDKVGRKNKVEELQQTGIGLETAPQSSLRRSLSLVMLSELVTPVATCNSEISENQVSHCAASSARNMLPNFRSSSIEQHTADDDGRLQLSSDVSDDDCSFAVILPLSQRLQLNQLQSEFAVSDSVSRRGPITDQLPLSDNIAGSSKDSLENGCVKQSSQRTVSSDSAMLPSRRRRALILRTASVLSDDVFAFEIPKPGANCNAASAEVEGVTSKDDNGSSSIDTDVFQCSRLDVIQKNSPSKNNVLLKLQSALHVKNKDATFVPVSVSKNSVPEVGEISSEFFDQDHHHVATDAVVLSTDRSVNKSTGENSQELNEQLTWSPRHCGNFCLETSIIDTSDVDFSCTVENDLQVDECFLNDLNNLSSGSRNSFHSIITGNDRNEYIDEVRSNDYKADTSDLLFDEPISLAEKSVLSLNDSESRCNISTTENVDSDCNDSDYSVIIID